MAYGVRSKYSAVGRSLFDNPFSTFSEGQSERGFDIRSHCGNGPVGRKRGGFWAAARTATGAC
jgi:hypothetical protein